MNTNLIDPTKDLEFAKIKNSLTKKAREKSFKLSEDFLFAITVLLFKIKYQKQQGEIDVLLKSLIKIAKLSKATNLASDLDFSNFRNKHLIISSALLIISAFLDKNSPKFLEIKSFFMRNASEELKEIYFDFPLYEVYGMEIALRDLLNDKNTPQWLRFLSPKLSRREIMITRFQIMDIYKYL